MYMKNLRKVWAKIKELSAQAQAKEAQKIADTQARNRQAWLNFYDRSIIRRQLLAVLGELPAWYSLHRDMVSLESVEEDNVFLYRISKTDITKHPSMAVCEEIRHAVNSLFNQKSFDAYEAISCAYDTARFRIQAALLQLSARADWETPEIQARFDAEKFLSIKGYEAAYKKNIPFLVKLEVLAVVDDENFVSVSVCVMDETDLKHWAPQNLLWV